MSLLHSLKKELGSDYQIRIIDFERCLYRDFGNGFNVEISGVRKNRKATLYLWFGDKAPDCFIVKTVQAVPCTAKELAGETECLKDYSNGLISHGYSTKDAIFNIARRNS